MVREGGSHSIWENIKIKKRASIPRHREIVETTAEKICKQLEIPKP
ncbi:MAG: type II toxin-antitoxin system HicA family toxin [Pyrinomonadaceae bacterium]